MNDVSLGLLPAAEAAAPDAVTAAATTDTFTDIRRFFIDIVSQSVAIVTADRAQALKARRTAAEDRLSAGLVHNCFRAAPQAHKRLLRTAFVSCCARGL